MWTHSPWVASFHTVSAGWPRWSPGLFVDSSTEDLQRKRRVQTCCHYPHSTQQSLCSKNTHTWYKTDKTPIIRLFTANILIAVSCFFIQTRRLTKAKDTSVPWLHRQVRVFDFSIKEKCSWIKSKVWKNSSSPSGWTIDETKSIMHEE